MASMKNIIISKRTSILIAIVIVAILIIFSGIKLKPVVKQYISSLGYNAFGQRTTHYSALSNYLQSMLGANKDMDIYNINIYMKDKHQDKIVKKRNEALDVGVLKKHKNDVVPASINNIDGKIRLKGDWTSHLEHKNKWSYRIKLQDNTLFGMNEFSIQHPKQREFQAEPVFFSILKDLGVIVPKYIFASVRVNGDDLGIMAIEQHFSNKMLEYNGREPGVILKFNENLLWDSRIKGGSPIYEDFRNSEIDAFGKKNIRSDSALLKKFNIGKELLLNFKTGMQSPHKVFDAEKMGTYLAVIDVFGARHALFWHNLRFYLNSDLKLEPIAFDASMDYREGLEDRSSEREEFSRILLSDRVIMSEYKKSLFKIKQYLENGSDIYNLDQYYSNQLKSEFFYVPRFDFNDLKYRLYQVMLDTIKSVNYDKKYDIAHADIIISALGSNEHTANKVTLENISPYLVKIERITDDKGSTIDKLSNNTINYINGKSQLTFALDLKYPIDKIKVNYKIIGQHNPLVEEIIRY